VTEVIEADAILGTDFKKMVSDCGLGNWFQKSDLESRAWEIIVFP